ncbi:signal peptide peptidase SppA [Pseudodesulfovibrio piezophilus]|uniref:Signal peptide peptidase SppA, 36K type n=1 Tax=Pseudodesulfovibrio piezophilus (strain DSM 21447 / JCM 15486 / C1TLV30) TaxID=1322246 RepID=M1WS72_PSEP2|nr:signal peptide peptidase SppA [Pseudodesulfovibrio piezophilus]CCH50009.1 Signal peptide peptidase SppA, 36K type [Pseudodesulfovibrio piezophilus C1TLV30]
MRHHLSILLVTVLILFPGCAPKIKLFSAQPTDPLREVVLEGHGEDKLALIHLTGVLTSQPKTGTFRPSPSQVQELVSSLELAASDSSVRGIVIAINSPGGTTTASDILYHEITEFKKRTKKTVVAALFDVAASGGYYAALPADWIIAHPTTITGSVGVIFMRPKLHELFDKIGIGVEVSKSGEDKDMGSPFRPSTPEETALFQTIIEKYADRFHSLVVQHRHPTPAHMALIKSARVFTADQAREIGLIDQIGYIQDAFGKTRELAHLPVDATIVTYRRDTYPNDNPYNTMTATEIGKLDMLGLDVGFLAPPQAGFYYVWPQGMTH